MDGHELIRTIGSGPQTTARRRWNCPSNARIAAYLEQRLEPKERSRFEAHLADCDFCLDIIGGLVRQQRTPELAEAPAPLVSKAANPLPAKTGWRISRRWVLVPASVALIVAAVLLQRSLQPEPSLASISAPTVKKSRPPAALLNPPSQLPEEQYLRKLAPVQTVEVLEPQPESVVLRERLRFRWKAVGDVAYYELRLANSEGDLMWQGQESNPVAQLPADLPLQPGRYFVWVRAYLHDGRTIKSDPVPFTISK
jgi:hypothetical protein